jgi:hypothetical protein
MYLLFSLVYILLLYHIIIVNHFYSLLFIYQVNNIYLTHMYAYIQWLNIIR